MEAEECAQPDNLEAVVDLVLDGRGTKKDIVTRLPRDDFRRARPNLGLVDRVLPPLPVRQWVSGLRVYPRSPIAAHHHIRSSLSLPGWASY